MLVAHVLMALLLLLLIVLIVVIGPRYQCDAMQLIARRGGTVTDAIGNGEAGYSTGYEPAT